ncbi:hypothetical protein A7979_05420 [Rothia nasimurium]|uniref:Uncharacterized protein n=1 Tax=Rothia nasimurium TaxID=85336 RepID=A0A1Y1RN71_9MICC|nr:hypothetical protein [Rothia nasimurium]ORC16050.1 hypothetical protein A7979_05420 [Rothia nasimurium]
MQIKEAGEGGEIVARGFNQADVGAIGAGGERLGEAGEGVVAGDDPGGVVECVEQRHGVYRIPSTERTI